jgi:nitrite reductase/ring-hydroxylating ferredoxin subunit
MTPRERVIGRASDLADGGPGLRFAVERGAVEVPAFAIRHRGVVHAYLNVCAHRELELDWVPGAFFDASRTMLICAAHGAIYEPDTGRCVEGPCIGACLVKLQVRERGDGAIAIVESARPSASAFGAE